MPIVIQTKRTFTFNHEDAKVTFTFPYSEDKKYSKDYLSLLNSPKDAKIDDVERMAVNIKTMNTNMRTAISFIEGFVDTDGNQLCLYDSKGKVDENIQKAIFEWVYSKEDLFILVMKAFNGETDAKNLTTGAQPVSNLDGVGENASPVI